MNEAPANHGPERPTDSPDPSSNDGDFEAFRPPSDGKAPTVMQILPALRSGGVERGTVDVAKALVAAGWNAIVVSAGGAMVHELNRVGATHIELPIGTKNPLKWRANFDQLVDLTYKHNVDILHARSRAPAWIGWRAARKRSLPFVTTFHGRYGDSSPLKKIYNAVMSRGDRVIAISHYIAGEVTRRYDVGPDRLRVIPRGVDIGLHDPDRVSAERMIKLANDWRLPDGVPVIMLPGRVTRWKGHELLIDALAQLRSAPFHCLIVGTYEGKEGYKAKLEAQLARLGLTPHVHFVGNCADMPAAYKLADVVVSASLDPEPFGRVIIEAQAMGRPVVASNHGGAAESMLDGETGWLVKPANAQALADGIRKALDMGEGDRARLSEIAIEHTRSHFSREDMCARTLAVYCEVLGLTPVGV
ncbi:MAG: glycosyltransferase family 4 protein [Alphaproteobacteria bacterium]|nr:glycosyltransferase family 4 protein [Alphaproteobacteria bacterium]